MGIQGDCRQSRQTEETIEEWVNRIFFSQYTERSRVWLARCPVLTDSADSKIWSYSQSAYGPREGLMLSKQQA